MRTTVALDDDLLNEAHDSPAQPNGAHCSDRPSVTVLIDGQVLGHPAVVGEVGLAGLANRKEVLALMTNLPQAARATPVEVMTYVDAHSLFGRGIGYVDAHLLASAALTPGASLWTRDKRLRTAAGALGTLDDRS